MIISLFVINSQKGFRDIYKKLIEEYKFKAKMPTCKQLDDSKINQDDIKQLTVKQTTDSRLVTKVMNYVYSF